MSKRILIFVDWFIPGFKAGGPIQSILAIVQNLASVVEIDIITRDRDLKEKHPYELIKPDCWIYYSTNVRICYLSPNYSIMDLVYLTREVKYDSIYANSFFSFQYSIKVRFLYLFSVLKASKLIVAPRGELKPEALKIKALKKKLFIISSKLFSIDSRTFWHTTSTEETNDLKRVFGNNARFKQIPNLSPNCNNNIKDRHEKRSGYLRIVFLARIISYKNLLYVIDILSNLKLNESQEIQFDIYGPIEDPDYWTLCNERLKQLPLKVKYLYKGVSKDSVKIFAEYDVFFFPTLGENYGHVIAESLKAGTVVLISDKTPWKFTPNGNGGWSFPLDSKAKFIEVIYGLLDMNENDFKIVVNNAISFARQNINTDQEINAYKEMFLGRSR